MRNINEHLRVAPSGEAASDSTRVGNEKPNTCWGCANKELTVANGDKPVNSTQDFVILQLCSSL